MSSPRDRALLEDRTPSRHQILRRSARAPAHLHGLSGVKRFDATAISSASSASSACSRRQPTPAERSIPFLRRKVDAVLTRRLRPTGTPARRFNVLENYRAQLFQLDENTLYHSRWRCCSSTSAAVRVLPRRDRATASLHHGLCSARTLRQRLRKRIATISPTSTRGRQRLPSVLPRGRSRACISSLTATRPRQSGSRPDGRPCDRGPGRCLGDQLARIYDPGKARDLLAATATPFSEGYREVIARTALADIRVMRGCRPRGRSASTSTAALRPRNAIRPERCELRRRSRCPSAAVLESMGFKVVTSAPTRIARNAGPLAALSSRYGMHSGRHRQRARPPGSREPDPVPTGGANDRGGGYWIPALAV